MPIKLGGTVTGADALMRLMRELEPKVFRKAARAGVSDAGTVAAKEMKGRVRERTGALRKSIGKKVKAVKSKKGYYAVVGPRRDPSAKKFQQQQAEFAAGKRKKAPKVKYRRIVTHAGREFLVDPAKYAHFVEYGRRAVTVGTRSVRRKGRTAVEETGKTVLSDGQTIFGKAVAAMPPDPFARPAWEVAKNQAPRIIRARFVEAKKRAARRR